MSLLKEFGMCPESDKFNDICRVHIAARTAIDDYYLFHFLLCFNLFDYSAWIADSHHI